MKYLKYAIGEIVLVVIGILIALSINNWNENVKKRELERKLLENLSETLNQNIEILQDRITSIPRYRETGKLFINAIENNLPYNDTLNNGYFHLALMNVLKIDLSSIGYEAIKNVGFEIIHDDTLRNDISAFFEATQPRFLNELNWGNNDSAEREKFIDEHFIQKYDTIINKVIYEPFDSNNILDNRYFIALIYKTDLQRSYFIGQLKRHLEDSQRILNDVKEKLK